MFFYIYKFYKYSRSSQQTSEMIYKCLNRFFYDATSLLPQHIVACVIQCVLKGVDIYKQ